MVASSSKKNMDEFMDIFAFSKLLTPDFMDDFNTNLNKMLEQQQKNFEALNSANQSLMQDLKTITDKQTKAFNETLREGNHFLREVLKEGTPEQKISGHAGLVQRSCDRATKDMAAINKSVADAQSKMTKILGDRLVAYTNEVEKNMQSVMKSQ